MSFIYYCPHCGQKLNVDDSMENTTASCPSCKKQIYLTRATQPQSKTQVLAQGVQQMQTPPPPQGSYQANAAPAAGQHSPRQFFSYAQIAISRVPRSKTVVILNIFFGIILANVFLFLVFSSIFDSSPLAFAIMLPAIGVTMVPIAIIGLLDDIRRGNVAILQFLMEQHKSQ